MAEFKIAEVPGASGATVWINLNGSGQWDRVRWENRSTTSGAGFRIVDLGDPQNPVTYQGAMAPSGQTPEAGEVPSSGQQNISPPRSPNSYTFEFTGPTPS